MANQVPIELFIIGRTEVDREEVQRWLDFIGVNEFKVPENIDDPSDPTSISNPALLIALAAKRCYKSFEVNEKLNPNITKIRKEWGEYLDNILKSGHGSVLEHAVYTFAIENVSRVFTAEMNRHRAGWAISEGSLRYIRFGEGVPYWEPNSIQGVDYIPKNSWVERSLMYGHVTDLLSNLKSNSLPFVRGLDSTINGKKHATRILMNRAFKDQQDIYQCLTEIWKDELDEKSTFTEKKQITSMMRRIIGLGVATGGVWTGNIRAIRHVMGMRCAPEAEEEILHVWSRAVIMIKEREQYLFGDFTMDDNGYWRPKYRKV